MTSATAVHRRAVRMDDAEVRAAIAAARSLQLATIDEDGTPHLSTLWFGLLDGDVVAWTPQDSHKARNLRRDPRVACLVEAGDRYTDIRGVSIKGRVELVDSPDELTSIATAIFERNFPPGERPDPAALVAGGRRVGLVLYIDSAASWDHRKLERSGPSA